MNRNILYALWAGGYVLCAALGFVPNPEGALRILLVLAALASFLPPLLLIRTGKKDTLLLIRNLSLLWLVLTLVLIIGNFLSVTASTTVGNVLYCLLVIVSSPMVCGQYWVVSLFGWSYLLFDSIHALKKA